MTRRRRPRRLTLVAVGGVLLVALSGARCTPPTVHDGDEGGQLAEAATETAGPAETSGPWRVVRVVDGDTLVVGASDGAEQTVRLLGIDTPETVHPTEPVQCFGPEASAAAAALVDGRDVWLELDPSQDAVDRYGRTLAYVWLDEDTMLNEVLVRDGYAREYTFRVPGVHHDLLTAAQAAAQAAGAGLWAHDTCAGAP